MGLREYDSLQLIKKGNAEVDMKGKNLVTNTVVVQERKAPEDREPNWERPEEGWIKYNVNASFLVDRSSGS
jgi:hypothetical protein